MSTEPPLTDDEISAVAEQLKEHSGVYTRRDIIAAAAATGSLGVLGALGIDEAEASHGVGRAGEPGDPLEAVYANKLGDASEPIHSSEIESLGTERSNNVFVAEPGEVPTKLSDADAAAGDSVVQLVPNEVYDPSETWVVKPGVELDFVGAAMEPSTDLDLFHIYPDAIVRRPRVDFRPNWTAASPFTSNVFVMDPTAFGQSYSLSDDTGVRGGRTVGFTDNNDRVMDGTVFYLHQNDTDGTNDEYVTWTEHEHLIQGAGTCIEMHSEGNGWLNSNRFRMFIGHAVYGVHQHGTGANGSNEFEVHIQPNGSFSDVGWFQDGAGGGNVLRGMVWDASKFITDAVVYGANCTGTNNQAHVPSLNLNHFTNNSGNDSNTVVSNEYVSPDADRTVFGNRTDSVGNQTVAIGGRITAPYATSVVVGRGAEITDQSAVVLGRNATGHFGSVVAGHGASATSNNSGAIGNQASASANSAWAIGTSASAAVQNVMRIGGKIDQLVFPAVQGTLGDGSMDASEVKFEIDETNDQLDVTVLYSDGTTVKSGSISLT